MDLYDTRPHLPLLAVDSDHWCSVHDVSPQRVTCLAPHGQDGAARSGDIVHQMVLDAFRPAHPRASHYDAGAPNPVARLRLTGLARELQVGNPHAKRGFATEPPLGSSSRDRARQGCVQGQPETRLCSQAPAAPTPGRSPLPVPSGPWPPISSVALRPPQLALRSLPT